MQLPMKKNITRIMLSKNRTGEIFAFKSSYFNISGTSAFVDPNVG
jgi:hypothetical protein